MVNFVQLLLFWVSVVWKSGEASNILGLFPHPGYSHFRVFYPIFRELVQRGHKLTVVGYFKAPETHQNYHEILLTGAEGVEVVDLVGKVPSRSFENIYSEFWRFAEDGKKSCEMFYGSKVADKILTTHADNPFEIVLTEFFNTDCQLGLVHILSTPFVGISTLALLPWHYDRVGLPDFPSFVPSVFPGYSEDMNYWERFVNFFLTKGIKLLYRFVEISDNEIIRKHLHIELDVREIAKRTSLILVNQHFTLNGARPLVPQVIEIGGVHIDAKNGSLPKGLKSFLDTAKGGVIFISWGSMIKTSTMPQDKVIAILSALQKFPYKVVWKWEGENVPITDEKYFFSRWTPQKHVLCHPNVKFLWCHGGLLGVSEAAYCGKPLLVTPIFADQFLNGRAIESRKIGVVLPFANLNEANVYQMFSRLQSENFSQNAQMISGAYRRHQSRALDTSVWWIEHVLEMKGNTFSSSPSVEMSAFTYYSLDVISVLIIQFCIIMTTLFIIMRFFCSRIKRHEQTSPQRSKKKKAA